MSKQVWNLPGEALQGYYDQTKRMYSAQILSSVLFWVLNIWNHLDPLVILWKDSMGSLNSAIAGYGCLGHHALLGSPGFIFRKVIKGFLLVPPSDFWVAFTLRCIPVFTSVGRDRNGYLFKYFHGWVEVLASDVSQTVEKIKSAAVAHALTLSWTTHLLGLYSSNKSRKVNSGCKFADLCHSLSRRMEEGKEFLL